MAPINVQGHTHNHKTLECLQQKASSFPAEDGGNHGTGLFSYQNYNHQHMDCYNSVAKNRS